MQNKYYVTFKQVILKVCEFCLKNQMFLNVLNYWCFREEELQKKNAKKLKTVGNINIKKMDFLDNFNKIMV